MVGGGPDRTRPDKITAGKGRATLVRLVIMAVVLGGGAWLVIELDRARRAQNCLESGQRNCRLIQPR